MDPGNETVQDKIQLQQRLLHLKKNYPPSNFARSNSYLSVIVRENQAGAKDRGRRLTSTFLPYKSHLKRLSTVVFSEVGGFFILR